MAMSTIISIPIPQSEMVTTILDVSNENCYDKDTFIHPSSSLQSPSSIMSSVFDSSSSSTFNSSPTVEKTLVGETDMDLFSSSKECLFETILPYELRLRIVSYLPIMDLLHLTCLSTNFAALCMDGSLWRTLDTSDYYQKITELQIISIIRASGRFMRHVNFRGCIQLSPNSIKELANSCPNIQTCNLQGCNPTSSSLTHFIKQSSNLVMLNLANIKAVHNITLISIGLHCNQLSKLNLSWCSSLTHVGIHHLTMGCKNLESLNLSGCTMLTDHAISDIANLSKLKQLNLSFCYLITSNGMRNLLTSKSEMRLSHLYLDNCVLITDEAFTNLPHGNETFVFSNLTHLSLAGCSELTDETFISILPNMSGNLRKLDIESLNHITDTSVDCFSRHAMKLEGLTMSFCDLVTDDAVLDLMDKCKKLQRLEVDNTKLGDRVVRKFARIMRERKKVEADAAALTTTSTISTIAKEAQEAKIFPKSCPISNFTSKPINMLEVYDCRNISSSVVCDEDATEEGILTIRSFWWWQERDRQRRGSHGQQNRRRHHRNTRRLNGNNEVISGDEGLDSETSIPGQSLTRRALDRLRIGRSRSGTPISNVRTDSSTPSARWRRITASRRRDGGCIIS